MRAFVHFCGGGRYRFWFVLRTRWGVRSNGTVRAMFFGPLHVGWRALDKEEKR